MQYLSLSIHHATCTRPPHEDMQRARKRGRGPIGHSYPHKHDAGCTAPIRFPSSRTAFIYPYTLILIKILSYMVVLYILDILDCPLYIRGGYASNLFIRFAVFSFQISQVIFRLLVLHTLRCVYYDLLQRNQTLNNGFATRDPGKEVDLNRDHPLQLCFP